LPEKKVDVLPGIIARFVREEPQSPQLLVVVLVFQE
jgi:hypothetical protein